VSVSETVPRQHVVVIGGGITGLTACYRLGHAARVHTLPLEVTLLEASGRLGGVVATSHHQECLLEHGPDCFISSKPWGVALCEELGLSDHLISTTTQYRQSFIVRRGKLVPVPQGFYLMVPGSLWSFAASPMLSWRGKLRLALDLVLPRRTATADESLAHFVTRRLGHEALWRIAQPMIGGIYTGDPEHLSLQATMPQFLEMERRHGSLIRAMWHNQRVARQQKTPMQGTSGPRYGLFVSFRQGMQTLIDRLIACLPVDAVRLHSRVRRLERLPDTSRWLIHVHDHPSLEADAVCIALPAPQTGQLLAPLYPALAAALQEIPYASSAIVNIAFRRTDVAHPLHGMGFVVPAIEQRTLMACSFSSVKFTGRAPQDQVLLRAFVGGALQQAAYDLADDVLQHAVLQDLRNLIGVTGTPLHLSVSRHPHSMPQYHIGHVQRVAHLETMASQVPGLVLAGNAYHGVGIPDCIHSGENAALAVLTHLSATVTPSPAP
jgi:protoporphyrinogen/coproporphyrinogen III oxidase